MKCTHCDFKNPVDAKFCQDCGQSLAKTCAKCDAVNTPTANFCINCGSKLGDLASTQIDKIKHTRPNHIMQGERRIVTIMFADISGFTAMAEIMDPEAVREMMNNCFERLVPVIKNYGGTVDKFIGDGVMALFGAPVAHENHAERALRAALQMTTVLTQFNVEHDTDLGMHFGINTGLVIAGGIGSPGRQEYSVMGDAVNLAARLESTSVRGEIFAGPETYRMTAPLFEFDALKPMKMKGKAESISVYRLLRETTIRTRFAISAARGLTPYVGREHELNLLRERFQQVKNGQGQIIFISGEAGIGKSRLLAEFRGEIEEETAVWLEGQCVAFRQHTPYLPLIGILKQVFGITLDDDENQIIERVDKTAATWEELTRETIPYLKFLLSVNPGNPEITTMDPRARQVGIFDGLRALLLQTSQTQPLVLAVEDLHWVDEQSETALTTLADVIATAPILLLLTYRPGYTHSLGERSYFNHLLLSNLQAKESASLARGVLQTSELPPELGQIITGKGEGNPLYIEELIKSLFEAGTLCKQDGVYELTQPITKIQVPSTIQEIILSRIDRLEKEAKNALQLASVIGREFTSHLLSHITDLEVQLEGVLEDLKFVELIYQKTYFPEQEYMFKHALTQSVAYSTLLQKRRKNLHQIIGTAIEELYSTRLIEHYEALAYHFFEGGIWEKALDYLIKAGDKAQLAFANQNARDYYTHALTACEQIGESAQVTSADILQRRGLILHSLEDSLDDFNRMLAIAQLLDNQHLKAKALAYRGRIEFFQHDLETSERTLKTALIIAGEEFEDIQFLVNGILINLYVNFNQHAKAKIYFEAAIKIATNIDDSYSLNDWGKSYSLNEWGIVGTFLYNWKGEFTNALNHSAKWRSKTARYGHIYYNQQWSNALALGGKGDYEKALTLLEDLITTYGHFYLEVPNSPAILNTIGWIYSELQNPYKARNWNKQSIEIAQRLELIIPEQESNARLNLGDNLLVLGQLNEAEIHFQHVEKIVRNPWPEARWMNWRYSQHLFHSYGKLWFIRGDYNKALSYANECLELAEESNSRKNIVKGRRLRGQALMGQGKLFKAEQELINALEVAREVGNPPQLWKTHVAHGDLLQAQAQMETARQSYSNAIAVIEEVATNLSDESLRETFLNSEHVQAIRAKCE